MNERKEKFSYSKIYEMKISVTYYIDLKKRHKVSYY